MNTRSYLIFVVLIAALTFFRVGVDRLSVTLVLAGAVLAAVPWYFGTRDQTAKPTLLETLFATFWLWFRRFVCFGVSVLCFWGSYAMIFPAETSMATHADTPWLLASAMALFGLSLIYLGLVGQGQKRYDWRDDLRLYRQNKRRYRWWF